MKTNKPENFTVINEDGTSSTYEGNDVCATLSINSTIHNGKMVCNANLRTHLYAKDTDGNYIDSSADNDRTLFVNDLFNCTDLDIQACVAIINAALQNLILNKNL